MTGLRHFQSLLAAGDRLYVGADGRTLRLFVLTAAAPGYVDVPLHLACYWACSGWGSAPRADELSDRAIHLSCRSRRAALPAWWRTSSRRSSASGSDRMSSSRTAAGPTGSSGANSSPRRRPTAIPCCWPPARMSSTRAPTTRFPFDTETAFAPVSLLVAAQYILVVNPSLPIESVEELIAYAQRATPAGSPMPRAVSGARPRWPSSCSG